MTGVSFKEGASASAAAAVAVLLFGSSDTKLPGGYAGLELSLDSPLVQVQEFPSELVLLGRATVMIRGIAKRLGLQWGLAQYWQRMALEALQSVHQPHMLLPIWSVSRPTVSSPVSASFMPKTDKLRFRDILAALKQVIALIQKYVQKKTLSVIMNRLPASCRQYLLKLIARFGGYE
jgi:hypothetical protein